MKTALILGGAAIAIYVVWKFGTAAAGPPLAASSAPLGSGNTPFPAAPPDVLQVSASVQNLLSQGIIASATPYDPGPIDSATKTRYTALGYVVTYGAAYLPGPNAGHGIATARPAPTAPAGSGVAVSTVHGLVPTSAVAPAADWWKGSFS